MTEKVEVIAKAEGYECVADLLSHIQRNIHVPKNREMKNGAGKLIYKYRNADDILSAIRKLLCDGAYVTTQEELKHIGDRYYLITSAVISYKGSQISATSIIRDELSGNMGTAQSSGTTASYAKKGALGSLFCLDDGADEDELKDTQSLFDKVKKQLSEADSLDSLKQTWESLPSSLTPEEKVSLGSVKDERKAALMIKGAK